MLNVPLRSQFDLATCLPVWVEMVLEYYDLAVNRERLWRLLGVGQFGTSGTSLPRLSQMGLAVQYKTASNEQPLLRALRDGIPPICLVLTDGLPYWPLATQHVLVVVDFDGENFLVNDPAYAEQRRQVSFNAFMLAWSGLDYRYALITPGN